MERKIRSTREEVPQVGVLLEGEEGVRVAETIASLIRGSLKIDELNDPRFWWGDDGSLHIAVDSDSLQRFHSALD